MSLYHWFLGWRALAAKYRRVLAEAWRSRHAISSVRRTRDEAEFLPVVLAIQGRPVSPAGQWTARILMMLVASLLAWAVLGRIDITVNGSGKLIPSGYNKTIAAVDVARVGALHVEEGQEVRAGDVLVELDARQIDSERGKAREDRQASQLQAALARALLAALATGARPHLAPVAGVDRARWDDAERHLRDQWSAYQARAARFDGDIRRYGEELPLAAHKEDDYSSLAQTGDVSKHEWLQVEQARIELARQLESAERDRTSLTADARKEAQDSLAEAERTLAEAAQDEARAGAHGDLFRLVAPVDGTVQQLIVHTVGGVVPAAQTLMQIVPTGRELEMEAFLENKDIGFVQEGQPAEVKIDAYDYSKYGTIRARVAHVSHDAIADDKRGLIYSVRVILERSTVGVDGRAVTLKPGMSGSVEIRTGSRRVIEYLLSPLVRHGHEALHER